MNKFFDFLEMDLSLPVIRELGQYICRFVENFGGEIPVEGNMGKLSFCATGRGDGGRAGPLGADQRSAHCRGGNHLTHSYCASVSRQ